MDNKAIQAIEERFSPDFVQAVRALARHEIEQGRQQGTSHDAARVDLRIHISRLEAACDQKDERIRQQKLEIEHLTDRLARQSHEILGLRQAPEVLKTELNALIQQIAKQRDELDERLAEELDKHQAKNEEIRQLQNDLAREQAALILARGERDSALGKLKTADAGYLARNKECAELRRQLDITNDAVKDLEASLHEARVERDSAKDEKEEALRKLEVLRSGMREIADKSDAYTAQ